ncbi:MAG: hypothetical protein WBF09_03955 [Candidatus Acidiferrum sp.]
MRTALRKSKPIMGGKAAEWKRLGDLALSELIVSAERYREITERLYPESEYRGRPLILHNLQRGEKRRSQGRKTDAEQAVVEVEVSNAWRVSPNEFPGREDELGDDGSVDSQDRQELAAAA